MENVLLNRGTTGGLSGDGWLELLSLFVVCSADFTWVRWISNLFLSLSKDKVRTAEGTAVIHDPREAAKLGVSFSYCEFFVLVIFIVFFLSSVFYFPLRDLCSQLLPTARTGSWPPTTPAWPSCTLARTSSACSTSSSPGSSGGLASCLQRPWVTPKSCWWTKESTCPRWRTRIRRAARTTRDQRRLVNRHRGTVESSSLTIFSLLVTRECSFW